MRNSVWTAAAACVALSIGLPLGASAQPGGAGSPAAGAGQAASRATYREIESRFGGVMADTKPSRDAVMRFSVPTEVREVFVRGGQRVKRGEALLRARDSEIVAVLELQRIRADNDLEVKNAEAALELAQFRHDMGTGPNTTLSPSERKELEIQLATSRITLEMAKFRLGEQTVLLRQAEGQRERFLLEAPFDGIIEEVFVDVGQGVGEQTPAVRIVNTEQLWLDAYAATDETMRLNLREGSPAWVLMDLPNGARLVEAKVLYVSPVADSVAQQRRVRVELANGGDWPAGTKTRVRFSKPGPEVDAMLGDDQRVAGGEAR